MGVRLNVSRRQMFRQAALQAGSVWAMLAQTHSHPSATSSPVGALQFFTPEQAQEVEAMAAQIIPADDLPGARETGVIRFIDANLAAFDHDQQPVYVAGLRELSDKVKSMFPPASRFSQLEPARQIELLRAIEKTRFFDLVRLHTVMGFFSNPEYGGNRDRAGWKMIGFEDAFVFQPPFGYYDGPQGQE